MVGDFNVTLDENLERFNYCYREIRNVRFRTKRCEVLEEFELEDIWRIRHPRRQTFTWSRSQKASRLDYIFISSFISGKVNKTSNVDVHYSDHRMTYVGFNIVNLDRGKRLLEDK